MKTASGCLCINGTFAEGSITATSSGKFKISNQLNENADVQGIILPKIVNCHTHLGDAFIPRPEKCSVEELVAPPDGLKHRLLRKISEEEQVSSMREAISQMAANGTSHFIDFRENGLEGVRRLLIASLGSGIVPIILGRPNSDNVDEISALLSVADGIGMSAISDLEYESLVQVSEHAKSQEKIFAIHASEVKQEDIGKILDLKPDFLVHMVKSSISDLEACCSAEVPIVICPSSNAFFGFTPPIREMLDAGVKVCLGSDNAMLATPDIMNEIRTLRGMFQKSVLSDEEIMKMAFSEGGKVLNSFPGLGDACLENQDFFVIEASANEPFRGILEARMENIHKFNRSVV